MSKFYYCEECRRIEKDDEKCGFCSSEQMKLLKIGDPVNIIGTKQKGKVFKMKEDEMKLIIVNAAKQKLIKEYKYEKIQKVL